MTMDAPWASPTVPSPILFITYVMQSRASRSTITSEPPQPPQKQVRGFGPNGISGELMP